MRPIQMKKTSLLAVVILILCLLTACGKQKEKDEPEEAAPTGPKIVEVKITGANFYDYFDYKDYPSFATDEDGNITACNLSCGF